ncbi:MAG: NAD(P)-binding protein, partial [Dermatophilaceae bacterium]|nr:NAD(P)-binding protein [Dermatophilaceae bacterium]
MSASASRRQLLTWASLGVGTAVAAACSGPAPGGSGTFAGPETAYPVGTGPSAQASAVTGAGTATAPPRVLIVGAGAAGIAAAQRLVAAGVSVEILEARDRIGGR